MRQRKTREVQWPGSQVGKCFKEEGVIDCQILLIGRGRNENCPNNLIQFIIDCRALRGFKLFGQGYR